MNSIKSLLGGALQHRYQLLGHLVFATLLVMSVFYVYERVLYIDSAYQVFQNLNFGILINDGRYSMFLSQLLPLLLVKMNAPILLVMCAYSVSFILIAYICYLLTVYAVKEKNVGLLMLFTVLCMNNTFFHCISETFQLMFFSAFLYAWLKYEPKSGTLSNVVYYAVLLFAIALCIFIHPIALFFVLFVLLYYLLCSRFKVSVKFVVASVLFLLAFILKNIIVQSGHDASFVPSADDLKYAIGHFFQVYSFKFFAERMLNLYLVPLLLFVVTSVFYLCKKEWIKLLYYVGFILCFFVMSVVVYYKGDGSIGMERSFLPLVFFAGLPFVCDVLPCLKHCQDKVFFAVLSLMLVLAFSKIISTSHSYAKRFDTFDEIISLAKEKGEHKLVIGKTFAREMNLENWGVGLESLMYSASQNRDFVVSVFVVEDDEDFSEDIFDDGQYYLAVPWWRFWKISEMNPRYFSLPQTTYKRLIKADGELKITGLR